MLSNFFVALEAVLPMFILIAIGMIIRKTKLIGAEENRKYNKMLFLVFFSTLMFNNIYSNGITEAIDIRLMIFGAVSVLVIYFLSLVFGLMAEKSNRSRGALIQAIFRSNFVIMGIPVAMNIFGKDDLGITAMMIAIIVPIYNILAVVTLEVFRGGRVRLSHLIFSLIKNPLMDGAVLGIIVSVAGIKLPNMIEGLISDMAAVTTPMALVSLGISFEFNQLKACGRNLIYAVSGRLIAVPALVLTAAALMGFRGVGFVTLIAIFASPSAVSSYPMAVSMDSDDVLAGNSVIMSTLISCVTMFFWIFLFKSIGMF